MNEESNAFIQIVDKNSKSRFQTLYFQNTPDELAATKSANINEVTILGRSEPIKTYGSSGPRSWTLELRFFADRPGEVSGDSDSKERVIKWTNWCESLVYPIYKNGISYGLPKLLFVFGNILAVNCICSNVSTQWQAPWELAGDEDENELVHDIIGPMQATVTLTLDQINVTPWGHDDVMDGKHNLGGT